MRHKKLYATKQVITENDIHLELKYFIISQEVELDSINTTIYGVEVEKYFLRDAQIQYCKKREVHDDFPDENFHQPHIEIEKNGVDNLTQDFDFIDHVVHTLSKGTVTPITLEAVLDDLGFCE